MSLDEDGPAKKAGLFIGDVITGWNGEAVDGPRDLIRRLGPDSVGADGRRFRSCAAAPSRRSTLTIGERPAA